MKKAIFITLSFLFSTNLAVAGPQYLALEGQIFEDASGLNPVEASSVTFIIEVLSPAPSECSLYRESHILNMAGSQGYFSLSLGAGTQSGVNYQDTNSLVDAFNNSLGLVSPTNCVVGTTYTAAANDGRQIKITYNSGSGNQTISQHIQVGSTPYALSAASVDGITSSDILTVNNGGAYVLTQANLEWVFANSARYGELQALLNGTSSLYSTSAPTADVSMNSQKIVDVAAPTANTDATNKLYVDSNIAGKATDSVTLNALGAGNAGEVMVWSGTQWTSSAPAGDSTKLPLAGGTMTGPIDMGAQNITNTGNISATSVGVNNIVIYNGVNYMGFQAPAGATDVIWTLPDTVGANGEVLTSNGAGGLVWSAAGGAVSNNESLSNGSLWVGDAGNLAQEVTMSGDATLSNTGAITLSNSAVTSAKISDGEIVNADINASAGIDATKIATGMVTNAEFLYLDGVTSGIQGQLNNRLLASGGTMTGQLFIDGGSDQVQLAIEGEVSQTANLVEVRNSAATVVASVSSDGSVTAGTNLTTKTYVDSQISSATSALINNVTNVGSGGADVFKQIAGGVVELNTINDNGSGTIVVTQDVVNNEIDLSVNQANLDHGAIGGLTDDDHVQYAHLTGRSGGQVLRGGTAASDSLTLDSTSNATKGVVSLQPSGGYVGVGNSTPSVELDVAGTIKIADGGQSCAGASDEGMIAYDNAGNTVKYCDGTGWQTLGTAGSGISSLNGLADSSQSFAVGATGTAPGFSSGAGVHTLNIPLANGAGVTAGLISKSDYDSFMSKTYLRDTDLDTMIQVEESADEDTIRFDVAGTESMVIDSSGRVGIGTPTPAVELDVSNGTINAAQICDENNSNCIDLSAGVTGDDLGNHTASMNMQLGTNWLSGDGGNEGLFVDSNGLVGFGTNTPATILDLNGAATLRGMSAPGVAPFGQGRIYYDNSANKFRVSENNGGWVDLIGPGGHLLNGGNTLGAPVTVGTNDGFNLNFETNGSTVASFDSTGNLGLGTTAPTFPLEVIRPNGSAKISLASSSTATTNGPGINAVRMRDTVYPSVVAVQTNDTLFSINADGADSASVTSGKASMQMSASGAWSPGAHPTAIKFRTTNNVDVTVDSLIINQGDVFIPEKLRVTKELHLMDVLKFDPNGILNGDNCSSYVPGTVTIDQNSKQLLVCSPDNFWRRPDIGPMASAPLTNVATVDFKESRRKKINFTSTCPTLNFMNMQDGGEYTLVLNVTGSSTCTFNFSSMAGYTHQIEASGSLMFTGGDTKMFRFTVMYPDIFVTVHNF